jgi:beta-carotene 15,15'-dioxygenase
MFFSNNSFFGKAFPLGWALLSLPAFFLLNQYFASQAAYIALILSLALGLPHGAADPLLAWKVADRSTLKTAIILLLYFSLVVLTWFAWTLLDPWVLILFLLLSWIHFILGSRAARLRMKILLGSFSIMLPVVFHSVEVVEVFKLLAVHQSWLSDTNFLQKLGLISLATILIIYAWMASKQSTADKSNSIHQEDIVDIIECILMILAAYCLPPLLFFAWFFCTLHSPLHLRDVVKQRQISLPLLSGVIIITLIATAVLAIFAHRMMSTGGSSPWHINAMITLTFQGLAALTFPHMLLVGIWQLKTQRDMAIGSNSP